MRAAIGLVFAMSLGCLQLTGVADYTVEEKPVCTPPPGSKCRVAPNCGCSETETCGIVSAAGDGICHPAGGVPRESACSAVTDCGKGMACVGTMCLPYCSTDADCDTAQCEPISLDGTQVQNVGVCRRPCDPAAPECGDGFSCEATSATRTSCVLPVPG
jgi:hypothetical protein